MVSSAVGSTTGSRSKSSKLIKCRVIEPFQKGETPTFTNHLKAGLKALEDDPHGLLILSG